MRYLVNFDGFLNEAFKMRSTEKIDAIKRKIASANLPSYYDSIVDVVDQQDYNQFVGHMLENDTNYSDFDQKAFQEYYSQVGKNKGTDANLTLKQYLTAYNVGKKAWEEFYRGKDLFKIWQKDQSENEVGSWFNEFKSIFDDGQLTDDEVLGLIDHVAQDDDFIIDPYMLKEYAKKNNFEDLLDSILTSAQNKDVKKYFSTIEDDLVKKKVEFIFSLGKLPSGGTSQKAEKYKGLLSFSYKGTSYTFSTETDGGAIGIAKKVADLVGLTFFAENSFKPVTNIKFEPSRTRYFEYDEATNTINKTTSLDTVSIQKILLNVLMKAGAKDIKWRP